MPDVNDKYDDIYDLDELESYQEYENYIVDCLALENEAQHFMEQGIPF